MVVGRGSRELQSLQRTFTLVEPEEVLLDKIRFGRACSTSPCGSLKVKKLQIDEGADGLGDSLEGLGPPGNDIIQLMKVRLPTY